MNEIVRFKGERQYVHATDELLLAEPLINASQSFTFTARKVGTCVSRWFEASNESGMNWEPIARLVVKNKKGEQFSYECRQDLERPINTAVEFDEHAIVRHAITNENSVKFSLMKGFTLWEHLSTLQKTLLQRIIGHQHWYFVRLKLDCAGYVQTQNISSELTITYSRQKGPLYLSDIIINKSFIGEIAYSKR